MINANELRIGNWVVYNSGFMLSKDRPVQLEVINPAVAKQSTPIPLTPGILEKCGFVRTDYVKHKSNPHLPQPIRDQDFYDYRKYVLIIDSLNRGFYTTDPQTIALIGDVNYLHQLQNLYFALTQTELNYTP